jgi:hypothetical protein
VNATDALRAALGTLTREPAAVFPFYLFAAAVGTVARVPLVVGIVVAVALLARAGRLERAAERLSGVDLDALVPDPNAGSGMTTPPPTPDLEALEALRDALSVLVTPTVVAVVSLAVVLSVIVGLVARSVAAAGTLHTTYAHLVGSPPTATGVRGIGAHWRSFLGLRIVRLVASLSVVGVGAGAFVAVTGTAAAPAAAVLAVPIGLLTVAGLAIVTLLFAFAGPAIVVDDLRTTAAIRQGIRFLLRKPGSAAVYVVGLLLVGTIVAGLVVALTFVGAPRVVGLATGLLVPPIVDGLKLALYAGGVRPGGRSGLRPIRSLRLGLGALWSFIGSHPVAVLTSGTWFALAALAGLSVAAGTVPSAPLGPGTEGGAGPSSGIANLGVAGFVTIAVNNWLVAVGAGFGGLAFGVPTLGSLALNGALVGGVAAVVERRTFLALVAPHGVIELPAIIVAGALGLHLGRIGYDAVRGRRSAVSTGGQLADAGRVLLGLAVVFVVAAAIEAFVTPWVATQVLS